jgi:tetratricopeptide (TPR) repeat protein
MWFISSILLFLHAYLVLSSNNNEAEDFANQRVANQYIIMCRAYLSRGAIDKAIKELQKAIHRAPRYIEPYFMRGSLFMESNELQPAVEDFLQVLHLSEGQNTTSLAHAVAICKQMYKSRQFDVVVAPLSVLHTYNTSDEEVGRLYANTLLQLEQQVAALYVLEKYPLDLSTKEAMLKMASIYENANRYE